MEPPGTKPTADNEEEYCTAGCNPDAPPEILQGYREVTLDLWKAMRYVESCEKDVERHENMIANNRRHGKFLLELSEKSLENAYEIQELKRYIREQYIEKYRHLLV